MISDKTVCRFFYVYTHRNICMCISICSHIHIMCTYTGVYICAFPFARVHIICINTGVYPCAFPFALTYIYITCIHRSICVCISICTHASCIIYIYIYINTGVNPCAFAFAVTYISCVYTCVFPFLPKQGVLGEMTGAMVLGRKR